MCGLPSGTSLLDPFKFIWFEMFLFEKVIWVYMNVCFEMQYFVLINTAVVAFYTNFCVQFNWGG